MKPEYIYLLILSINVVGYYLMYNYWRSKNDTVKLLSEYSVNLSENKKTFDNLNNTMQAITNAVNDLKLVISEERIKLRFIEDYMNENRNLIKELKIEYSLLFEQVKLIEKTCDFCERTRKLREKKTLPKVIKGNNIRITTDNEETVVDESCVNDTHFHNK